MRILTSFLLFAFSSSIAADPPCVTPIVPHALKVLVSDVRVPTKKILATSQKTTPQSPAVSKSPLSNTASSPRDCSQFKITDDHYKVMRRKTLDSNECIANYTDLRNPAQARTYSFNSNGIFQVFDSFDFSPNRNTHNGKATGTRAYFVFPRKQPPSVKKTGKLIQFTLANGETISIDSEKQVIASSSFGAALTEKKTPQGTVDLRDPTARGQVNITRPSRGLILDTGWKMGGAAFDQFQISVPIKKGEKGYNPLKTAYRTVQKQSTLINRQGKTCKINNNQLFRKIRGEARIKSDAELKEVFLSCGSDFALS